MRFLNILLLLLIATASGYASNLNSDGHLQLYHSHHNEWIEVGYEQNGVVQKSMLRKINRFMRSRDGNEECEIDIRLIRLMDHIQDHFKCDTVEVISGYRSPGYNEKLFEQGRNVARESRHKLGLAADIHCDEITEASLMKYVRKIHDGGVGYYPNLNMVHVEIGPKKFWQEGTFSDRTDVGIFNEDLNLLKLWTDHFFYSKEDLLELNVINSKNYALQPFIGIDQFWRGKWKNFDQEFYPMKSKIEKIPLKSLPYGKFRWKIGLNDGRNQYSNEFYVKRQ